MRETPGNSGFSTFGGGRALLLLSLLLLACFSWQCIGTARENSTCNDEGKHIVTGWWLLKHRQAALGIDNSPLTAVFALPLVTKNLQLPPAVTFDTNAHTAGFLLIQGAADPEGVVFSARLVAIAFGVATLIFSGLLSRDCFGAGAGVFTLAILAFDPNMVAHFSLASTDALLTFGVVFFLLCFCRMVRAPSPWSVMATGLALGIALIAKYTALLLVPLLPLLIIVASRPSLTRPWIFAWGKRVAVIFAMALIVVWVGYGFHFGTGAPFFTIPGFWRGLEQARGYAAHGMPTFFRGDIGTSWPLYFVYVPLLKLPIAQQVLWLVAAVLVIGRSRRKSHPAILVPLGLALVFYLVCLFSHLNIGLRHMLPCIPLMAVTAGVVVVVTPPVRRFSPMRVIASLLWLWMAVEALAIHPNSLAYFNQLAGGPLGGARYLGDSNLDWGQDLKRLKKVLSRHGIDDIICAYFGNTDPAAYGISYQYLPIMLFASAPPGHVVSSGQEILAVSVNNLQGTFYRVAAPFEWLTTRQPIATAGYSIYLYDITGDSQAHAHLSDLYAAYGRDALAEKEKEKAAADAGRSPP